VEGLIEYVAFLFAENRALRESLALTGMVKVHPNHPDIEKPVESARQYLRSAYSYAVVIKTLNGVLSSNLIGDDNVC